MMLMKHQSHMGSLVTIADKNYFTSWHWSQVLLFGSLCTPVLEISFDLQLVTLSQLYNLLSRISHQQLNA